METSFTFWEFVLFLIDKLLDFLKSIIKMPKPKLYKILYIFSTIFSGIGFVGLTILLNNNFENKNLLYTTILFADFGLLLFLIVNLSKNKNQFNFTLKMIHLLFILLCSISFVENIYKIFF